VADSGVIYGETDTFKTTAIAHMARYIADKVGKPTLLFSADGGGWKPVQEEIDAGMIRPYRCDTATIPLPILRKVSQGYWPRNPEETDLRKLDFCPIDWNDVGAVAIEGFTSIGTMLMRHVADKNLKTGEEGTTPFSMPIMVSGEMRSETFAGNSRGHYNFVQNQLYGLTMNFISWPVEYVLFTGHEKKTEDGDRATVMGVGVPGKAVTALIPTWVGDCIHAQDYNVPVMTRVPKIGGKPGETEDQPTLERHCRYYFRKHPDPVTGLIFPAKPRVTHSAVKELDRRFPGGFFEPTPDHGFDLYLKALDELAATKSSSLKGWRERADAKLGRGPKVASPELATASTLK
jgi:hypothetical protein